MCLSKKCFRSVEMEVSAAEGPPRPKLLVGSHEPAGESDEDVMPGEDYCCEACDRIRRSRRRARRREMAAQEALIRARLVANGQ